MRTLIFVYVTLFVAARGQTPSEEPLKSDDKCSVEGTVVNLQTGEPLKKAHVSLTLAESQSMKFQAAQGTITDAAGHFVLSEVTPGKYKIAAERNGFVRMEYGAKDPVNPGTLLTLSKGQKLKGIAFRMTPTGIISGKVVDEDGDPLVQA